MDITLNVTEDQFSRIWACMCACLERYEEVINLCDPDSPKESPVIELMQEYRQSCEQVLREITEQAYGKEDE